MSRRGWHDLLDSAARERDEIEVALNARPPWWVEDELRREWSWRVYLIEEAERMLGLRQWYGGENVSS